MWTCLLRPLKYIFPPIFDVFECSIFGSVLSMVHVFVVHIFIIRFMHFKNTRDQKKLHMQIYCVQVKLCIGIFAVLKAYYWIWSVTFFQEKNGNPNKDLVSVFFVLIFSCIKWVGFSKYSKTPNTCDLLSSLLRTMQVCNYCISLNNVLPYIMSSLE